MKKNTLNYIVFIFQIIDLVINHYMMTIVQIDNDIAVSELKLLWRRTSITKVDV